MPRTAKNPYAEGTTEHAAHALLLKEQREEKESMPASTTRRLTIEVSLDCVNQAKQLAALSGVKEYREVLAMQAEHGTARAMSHIRELLRNETEELPS